MAQTIDLLTYRNGKEGKGYPANERDRLFSYLLGKAMGGTSTPRLGKVTDVRGDGTYLIVDISAFEETALTLEECFVGKTIDGVFYNGYFADTGRTVASVADIKITTDTGVKLTTADLAYLHTGLTSLAELDMTEANIAGNIIEQEAFMGDTHLKHIAFPDTLSGIGARAFKSSAMEIFYSESVETIGESAFEGCTALLVASAPSCVELGYKAFYGCTALDTIVFPSAETVGTDASGNTYAFGGEPRYIDVAIPAQANAKNYVLPAADAQEFLLHGDDLLGATLPTGFIVANNSLTPCVYHCPGAYEAAIKNIIGDSVVVIPAAAEYINLSNTTGMTRVTYAANGKYYHLSDFGMGDLLVSYEANAQTGYTITKVWRAFFDKIVGTYTMEDLTATSRAETELCAWSFAYLDAIEIVKGGAYPIFVMPETVTRVGTKAFINSKLFGVEGPGVLKLGYNAFEYGSELRWAKFVSLTRLEYWLYGARQVCEGFLNCSKLAVLEVGVIDNSDATNNMFGTLKGCSKFKYVIFHTETASQQLVINRNWLVAGFGDYIANSPGTASDYKILLSKTSSEASNHKNYYNDFNGASIAPRVILTDNYMADTYRYASDYNPSDIGDGWTLADIGYGDYLCYADHGEAIFGKPIVEKTITATETADTYTVPNHTVDGLPITSIGYNAYGKVTFVNNVKVNIPSSIKSIGAFAFLGAVLNNGTDGLSKSISEVNLGTVETVGESAFLGITALTKVTAGAIEDFGATTFQGDTALVNIEISGNNEVEAVNLFNNAVPSALVVKVRQGIYDTYYAALGTWGGIDTRLVSAGGHFGILPEPDPE